MLHRTVGEHGFVGKALAERPFPRALADQQAIVALAAKCLSDAHRVGDIHQIPYRTKGQRIAVHIGGVEFHVAIFGGQPAVTDRLVIREVFNGGNGIHHRR
ncbi:hypothetical protein D3C86_1925360 [compost metagenome]